MAKKSCSSCGRPVAAGDTRCLSCGAPVRSSRLGLILGILVAVLGGGAMLAFLVAVMVIGALTVLGQNISEKFDAIATSVEAAEQQRLEAEANLEAGAAAEPQPEAEPAQEDPPVEGP